MAIHHTIGTTGDDLVFGLGGWGDFFFAATDAGNDTILGGTATEVFDAGNGDDFIDAGAGNVTMSGGAGNDTLIATDSNAEVNAGNGADLVIHRGGWYWYDRLNANLGAGNDTAYGDEGHDNIDGDEGSDKLFGGAGEDNIDGDEGSDKLFGGAGEDYVNGGEGRDTVRGGADNDFIDGDEGSDKLFGGTGTDEFVFRGYSVTNGDRDVIKDYSSSEGDLLTFQGMEIVATKQVGADVVFDFVSLYTNDEGEKISGQVVVENATMGGISYLVEEIFF